jgi:sulfatase modifying factor 1
MDPLRTSRWLVVLVAVGCGGEFAAGAGDDGSGDASSDTSLITHDSSALATNDDARVGSHEGSVVVADDGATKGTGGSKDASSTGISDASPLGDRRVVDAHIDARETGSIADSGIPEIAVGLDAVTVDFPDVALEAAATRDAEVDRRRGCPANLPGPALVEVPAPSGTTYCIDATEVTNLQYALFLTAKGVDTTGQDTWCSWNTTFVPNDSWPTARDDYPVVSVDWCDAFAYCKWAGKAMCGKIGGGPNLQADNAYAPLDQWYNACSQGGTLAFPYGATYDATACNGTDNGVASPLAVGAKPACAGGFPGLVDMSGNLSEWEDSCDGTTDGNDMCRLRGGAYINPESDLRCDAVGGTYRNFWYHFAGIRCCAPSL